MALAIGLSFSATAQAGNVSGSMLGNTCAGCHGLNGASAGDTMPSIGGQSKGYIEKTMKAYRDGSRSSTIMGRIAKGYDDVQIAAMSEFFAKQKWVSAPQQTDPKLVAQGEAYVAKVCGMCHADGGTKVSDDPSAPPRLAGQWSHYLRIYLSDVNNPAWKTPHPMKNIFEKATPQDIEGVLQFFASKK
jgi:sulfide dehydrogenase cytochrome subunit